MALREIIAFFGFEYDKSKLEAINKGVENVKHNTGEAAGPKGLGAFVTGLQGALAAVTGGAFLAFTSEIKEQAAALQDTADQTGLATDEIQAWTLAANLGGASAQDFVAGLRKLSKELATGVDESGQQSKLFKKLGLEARDSSGQVRELSDVLPEIAEKFAGLKTGAERSALAQQIFGKAGSKLVPVLSKGAAGVAELRAEFEALGGGFSKEAIERADAYDDALIKLNFSFFGLKSLLATQVFPILENVIGSLTKAVVSSSKWLKETTLLENGVKALALTIGLQLGKALAPYLKSGLKFAAIFLAVDDLIAFLRGQDSVIGAILNGWFGDGTADVVRAWALDAIAACKSLVVGGLDLIKLGLNEDEAAVERLEAKFMASSQAIGDAVQSVIDKVFLLKDAFSFENLQQGANELLDLLSSDADANQRRKERRDAAAMKDNAKSGDQLLRESGRNARAPAGPFSAKQSVTDLLGGVRGNTGSAPAVAPINNTTNSASTVNNFPVKVDVTIKGSATAKEVHAGVAAGIADYRVAIQNLEQRR